MRALQLEMPTESCRGREASDGTVNTIANTVRIDTHGLSDTGRRRADNQDHFVVASFRTVMEMDQSNLPKPALSLVNGETMARLIVVADGVGGSAAGAQASGLAAEAIARCVTHAMQCFCRVDQQVEEDLLNALETSVRHSDAVLRAAVEEQPEYAGMATTLTVAYILWPRAYMVHVGDSRCYLLRGSELRQITTDQTVAQGLVDRGLLSADRVDRSPFTHVLSSAVGSEMHPTTSTVELERGDVLLLCTDGLTKHVPNDRIADLLASAESSEDTCQMLLSAALEGGGTDNVTTVVSRFD